MIDPFLAALGRFVIPASLAAERLPSFFALLSLGHTLFLAAFGPIGLISVSLIVLGLKSAFTALFCLRAILALVLSAFLSGTIPLPLFGMSSLRSGSIVFALGLLGFLLALQQFQLLQLLLGELLLILVSALPSEAKLRYRILLDLLGIPGFYYHLYQLAQNIDTGYFSPESVLRGNRIPNTGNLRFNSS